MFARWKQKMEEKNAKRKAITESGYWKSHPKLRRCLLLMRGSCAVVPMQMHEAAIAAVNIALYENTWSVLESLTDPPEDFPGETVCLVWDDEKLPVLKAPWALVTENINDVKAVARQLFLVSETLDRIIWFDEDAKIKLYVIT